MNKTKSKLSGTSLAVQWLRPRTSTARDTGSIPDWRTKISHAVQHGKKKKKSQLTDMGNEWLPVGRGDKKGKLYCGILWTRV